MTYNLHATCSAGYIANPNDDKDVAYYVTFDLSGMPTQEEAGKVEAWLRKLFDDHIHELAPNARFVVTWEDVPKEGTPS